MLQLDPILSKEATEEVERWDHKPTLVEVSEPHHLPRLRKGSVSLAEALHSVTSFGGRRPFAMRCCNFTSITVEGTHSPISQCR
jgi:hypothetical protein